MQLVKMNINCVVEKKGFKLLLLHLLYSVYLLGLKL